MITLSAPVVTVLYPVLNCQRIPTIKDLPFTNIMKSERIPMIIDKTPEHMVMIGIDRIFLIAGNIMPKKQRQMKS